jgi:hypothetical protein
MRASHDLPLATFRYSSLLSVITCYGAYAAAVAGGRVFATGERVVAVEGRQGPFEMKDLRV